MLKRRIISCLMLQNGLVVQSIGFKKFLPIGKLDIALEFLEYWDIDEIVILDINATLNNRTFDYNIIKEVAKKVFIPISIGGGIRTIEDVRKIIASGADKIILNTVAYEKPQIIQECVNSFGKQSVIVSIDVRESKTGKYDVYIKSGSLKLNISLSEYIKRIEDYGAGEIIINSIDRDGSKKGYDINLINYVSNLVNIPVIALGGAKNSSDMVEVLSSTQVSGVAAGNMFHYTEHSTAICKTYLKTKFENIRLNKELDYSSHKFDNEFRILPEIK